MEAECMVQLVKQWPLIPIDGSTDQYIFWLSSVLSYVNIILSVCAELAKVSVLWFNIFDEVCSYRHKTLHVDRNFHKAKAWHSLIKELGLDRVAKLTASKKKLYGRIRTRERALCNLGRSTWKRIWGRFVSWTVILCYWLFHLPWMCRLQDFRHPLLGTVAMKPEGRRCSFKDKLLALSLLKRGSKSYTFLHSLFPLPSSWTLQTILNTSL